jgi:hypothetical protein
MNMQETCDSTAPEYIRYMPCNGAPPNTPYAPLAMPWMTFQSSYRALPVYLAIQIPISILCWVLVSRGLSAVLCWLVVRSFLHWADMDLSCTMSFTLMRHRQSFYNSDILKDPNVCVLRDVDALAKQGQSSPGCIGSSPIAINTTRHLVIRPRVGNAICKSLKDIILYPFPVPVIAWALEACRSRSTVEDTAVVVTRCQSPKRKRHSAGAEAASKRVRLE